MGGKLKRLIFSNLLIGIIAVGIITGCTPVGGKSSSTSPAITILSKEELDYFNGDDFFNGEYMNIRNQFLSSLYDSPEEIDLFQLFYCGSGNPETPGELEREAVVSYNGWDDEPDTGCGKISRTEMDSVLLKYMGLTVKDTKGVRLDEFTYLKEYDAYYHYHGDTNYRREILFTGGEKQEDIIHLFYNDTFMGDGDKVLTLRKEGDGYIFISNQKVKTIN